MNYKSFLKLTVNSFLIIALLGGIFYFSKSVKAQEEFNNLIILYQGGLFDSGGKPIEDGRYNMRFVIYDAETEGDILWQEEHTFYNTVSIKNGRFKIILGRITPVDLDLDQGPFWLGTTVGTETEEGEIVWDIGTEPRKEIISLSRLLKEGGLDYLREDGLTEEEWENIFQLLEEKLGEQPDLVVLFDLGEIEEARTEASTGSSRLFDVLQNLINFISEKISEIGDKISEIGERISEILIKLDRIISALGNIGSKVDTLYKVLVVDKGLAPAETLSSTSSEETIYSNQKVERLILEEGKTSVRIFNQSIEEESLIFISFLEDPGDSWWISEKVPGDSFTISLKEPAPQDLRFDYWILNEEEIQQTEEQPEELPQEESGTPVQNPESDETSSSTCETCEEEPEPEPEPEPTEEPEEEAQPEEQPLEEEPLPEEEPPEEEPPEEVPAEETLPEEEPPLPEEEPLPPEELPEE